MKTLPFRKMRIGIAALLLTVSCTVTTQAAIVDPDDVPNLIGWYDASQLGLSNGSTVNGWANAAFANSGALADMLLANGTPTLVTNGIGGVDTVHFDTAGGADQLYIPTNAGSGPLTLITVSRMSNTANARLITSYNKNWLMGYWGNGQNRMHTDPGGWLWNPNNPVTTDTHFYSTIQDTGRSAFYDGLTTFVDNTQTRGTFEQLSLGAWLSGGSEGSTGDVSEVIIYDRQISSSEYGDVMGYLFDKYGRPPLTFNATTDGNFSNSAMWDMPGGFSGPPQSEDTGIIANGYDVVIDSATTVGSVNVHGHADVSSLRLDADLTVNNRLLLSGHASQTSLDLNGHTLTADTLEILVSGSQNALLPTLQRTGGGTINVGTFHPQRRQHILHIGSRRCGWQSKNRGIWT